jgi:hypothetical protein
LHSIRRAAREVSPKGSNVVGGSWVLFYPYGQDSLPPYLRQHLRHQTSFGRRPEGFAQAEPLRALLGAIETLAIGTARIAKSSGKFPWRVGSLGMGQPGMERVMAASTLTPGWCLYLARLVAVPGAGQVRYRLTGNERQGRRGD